MAKTRPAPQPASPPPILQPESASPAATDHKPAWLTEVKEPMLPAAGVELSPEDWQSLWEVFQQIGRTWFNVFKDSAGQRSSWLEFITLRCESPRCIEPLCQDPQCKNPAHMRAPSYLGEYRNALEVVAELVKASSIVKAYEHLFTHKYEKVEDKIVLKTQIDHAKFFVIDEFIRMQIVGGGFRGFGTDENGRRRRKLQARNYNGFVRGSRYNRVVRVRAYREKEA